MNRRNFLAGLGALVGGVACEQAIPFGRVWSFPKEIKRVNTLLTIEEISREHLKVLNQHLRFVRHYDIETDRVMFSRFDVLHGWETMSPQMFAVVAQTDADMKATAGIYERGLLGTA